MGRCRPDVLAAASGQTPRAREEDTTEGRALPGCPQGMEPCARWRPKDLRESISGWRPGWAPPHSSGVRRRSLCTLTSASGGPGSLPQPSSTSLLPGSSARVLRPQPSAPAILPTGRLEWTRSYSLFLSKQLMAPFCVHTRRANHSMTFLKAGGPSASALLAFREGQLLAGGPSRARQVLSSTPGPHSPGAGASPPQGVTTKDASRHRQMGGKPGPG